MAKRLMISRIVVGLFFFMLSTVCAFHPIAAQSAYAVSAGVPFVEDFESGSLGSFWTASSTGAGRIAVTSSFSPRAGAYHLVMDSAVAGPYSLNELVLTIDLSGRSGVILSFFHKHYRDESHALPSRFTGSRSGDGVSVSADGTTWHRVKSLTASGGISVGWKQFEVDLDTAVSAAGIRYTDAFKIKFQQVDNYPIPSDGFAFDDIQVYESMVDSDGDGLPDDWELRFFKSLAEDGDGDPDNDGLSNLDEFQLETDPMAEDSDADQMPDGFEVHCGLDPLDPGDAADDLDGDGITNLDEYRKGTDPTAAENAVAIFPFVEDFESGTLRPFWKADSTGTGRISVTSSSGPHRGSFHLTMDSASMLYSLNELVLTIDLSGKSGVKLKFFHKHFRDEGHALPAHFTGSRNGDGVAVSSDGTTWHTIQGLTSSQGVSLSWKQVEVDLDAAVAAAGIGYSGSFKIKFQQYDNYPIASDGFAFDDIALDAAQPGGDPGTPGSIASPTEQEVLRLVNEQRALNGLPPLQTVDALVVAARRHSDDMAQNNFLSHTGSDGSTPWDRMRDAGYRLGYAGENVAAGYSTPESVVNGWMNSSGHRANILSPNFCHAGAGYSYSSTSSYRHYWTLTFGCN